MSKYFQTFVLVSTTALLVLTSCHHQHNIDPVLAEAQVIQDEAIHVGISVDSIIKLRLLNVRDTSTIKFLYQLKTDVSSWRSSMVAVPGAKHKCNHDHGAHVHVEGSDASHLSPAENKKVQEEWKAVIDTINLRLR